MPGEAEDSLSEGYESQGSYDGDLSSVYAGGDDFGLGVCQSFCTGKGGSVGEGSFSLTYWYLAVGGGQVCPRELRKRLREAVQAGEVSAVTSNASEEGDESDEDESDEWDLDGSPRKRRRREEPEAWCRGGEELLAQVFS